MLAKYHRNNLMVPCILNTMIPPLVEGVNIPVYRDNIRQSVSFAPTHPPTLVPARLWGSYSLATHHYSWHTDLHVITSQPEIKQIN